MFVVRFRISLLFSLLAAGLALICLPGSSIAAGWTVTGQLDRWVDRGAVLFHDEAGLTVVDYHADRVLVPASIIKIYTALVALEVLGDDFRFKTGFYRDVSGNLGIRGWGDPRLISEEIHLIADRLAAKGIKQVRQVQLDQTSFSEMIDISGRSNSLNPYDALNGALIVNYNTLFLGRSKDGVIYSAESVTPMTPLSRELGRLLKPGAQDRFNLSTRPGNAGRYAGELFGEILKLHGIELVRQKVGSTVIDQQWKPIYTHYNTAPLPDIIRGLLKYSNNLIANQIYLVAGAEVAGYPASLHKARAVFQSYFNDRFPEYTRRTVIDEASGISRVNRMSARTMMAVLEAFRPWANLLDRKKGALLKSGTLKGVYNYAGYIQTQKGYRPFVILLNQPKNRRDSILKLLLRL